MRRVARSFALLAGFLLVTALPSRAADLQNTLYLDVPAGRVVIELRPDLAPKTVAHIKALTRRGFYDGLTFHRVIGRSEPTHVGCYVESVFEMFQHFELRTFE